MAIDRMQGNRFHNAFTYQAAKKQFPRVNSSNKEELMPETYPKYSTKSITVPGQAQTIKELMDRYEKGRPIPVD